MKQQLALSFAALCLPLVATTCAVPPDINFLTCDPEQLFPSARCLAEFADAGVDATPTNQPTDFDPWLIPPAQWRPSCDGFCAPNPSGMSADLFSSEPVTLYIGPNNAEPLECPPSAPTEKWRLYDELVAPPAACEACSCEASKGECLQPPEKIELRAGTCGESGVAVSPFDGPTNWTGACSKEGGLSADTMCGNEPCAQSVWAAPLNTPAGDACSPTTEIPLSTKEFTWKTRAIACQTDTPIGACDSTTQYCAAQPGPEWLTCVYAEGVYNLSDCPNEYNASVHHFYPYDPVDDRGCSDCSCGAPMGSACIGNLRVYNDAACSTEFVNMPLGSMGENCTNIIPAGRAVGAKRVTDLTYLPGTCGSSGGEPKGSASANAARAVTFCCMNPSVPTKTIPE